MAENTHTNGIKCEITKAQTCPDIISSDSQHSIREIQKQNKNQSNTMTEFDYARNLQSCSYFRNVSTSNVCCKWNDNNETKQMEFEFEYTCYHIKSNVMNNIFLCR